MPSRCPDEDTELLGDSGLAAAVKARGGDGPEPALAKPRPSRGPAGGRAVLHDPEMARAYSKLLHSPAPLSFLQSWFPAGPAALRLKEGLSLVSGVAGKDIQTVSLCPVGHALVVTHIPSVPLQSPRATLSTPSFTRGC